MSDAGLVGQIPDPAGVEAEHSDDCAETECDVEQVERYAEPSEQRNRSGDATNVRRATFFGVGPVFLDVVETTRTLCPALRE